MRFWHDNLVNHYYRVVCLLDFQSGMPEQKDCYGICDEKKGGYVAFAMTLDDADRIVKALNK